MPDAIGNVLPVGPERSYINLQQAAAHAQAGDTLLFDPGVYPGDQSISALQGRADRYIYLLAADKGSVVISGGQTGWHFSDVHYLHIEGFVFAEQTGNGLNVDDGSDYTLPAHHISIINCTFRDIRATGNSDLLKLSGVDDFQVMDCRFENGAKGGSGIDMVGCHRGSIGRCRFTNMGSNSIQAKGGSDHISIFRNHFKDGGQRTLNLGGSTGLPYFRPANAPFEAADLQVYSNIIVGSDAPIAFAGSVRVLVAHNTIIDPGTWVIRILQETVDEERFLACGDNVFQNNLIYYSNIRTEVNIGAHVRTESFSFLGNLWYNAADPAARPQLPVEDPQMIYGEDPLFVDLESGDLHLQSASPAGAKTATVSGVEVDFYGRPFADKPTIGAICRE
ncbi:MAG: right-handed parallel beta-helix repeat-containing protein [Saprospiraceae bacterium]|nr:right-handed parallel beta-helix repeat-containing protein [Lewinella sp.]